MEAVEMLPLMSVSFDADGSDNEEAASDVDVVVI